MLKLPFLFLLTLLNLPALFAQEVTQGPHILVVMAHPDDIL
ncbi:hypothetical protein [Mucilaginibacter sp.]